MNLPLIRVAAAVLLDADGHFLLASRPVDKDYAGYWEFPGGKLEAGESAIQALVRELEEELGIRVTQATPWISRQYAYSNVRVELEFFRVSGWAGELQPKEGQKLAWQSASELTVGPLLAANIPIIKALALPVVMAITHAENAPDVFIQKLELALAHGVKLIQVREAGLVRLAEFARTVVQLAHASGAQVVINSNLELARQVNADGVHLSAAQLAATVSRPDMALVGASCHNADELNLAEQLGCDYALLSPVLPTLSHPDAATLGWSKFAALTCKSSIPVYALGGMSAAHLHISQQHGAHGIALLRGAW